MGSANGENAYARTKRAYISLAEMSADVETSSEWKRNVNEGEVSFYYAVLEQKGHLQMAHVEMSADEGISSEQYVELIEEISSEWRVGMCVDQKTSRE
jgi:hypothetical protein